MKRKPDASTKSIDTNQPGQSAQADLGRNFWLWVSCLYIKGLVYLMIRSVDINGVAIMDP